MFTKQHYEAIAELLQKHRPLSGGRVYWLDIVEEFVMLLRYDNPSFDEEKFRRVCLEG